MNEHTPRLHVRAALALWLLLALALGRDAAAQPCAYEGPAVPIPTVSDFEVCYEVEGLTAAVLGQAGQGVCGVRVAWTHDYIENLALTLRSPAGQEVQLVGPGITGFSAIATAGARWDINFVDCGAPTSPVAGTGPRFDGGNAAWQTFGNYSGSYEPFAGCLGDLDAGPANGQWCLRVQSSAVLTNADRLAEFEVAFCDDDGMSCCRAEVPAWAAAPPLDTAVCAGDAYLDLGFALSTTQPPRYQQVLTLLRDDTVVAYSPTDSFDLRAEPAGVYEVCGYAYWIGDANALAPPGTSRVDFENAIAAANACIRATDTCQRILVLARPDTTRLDTALCAGETLRFGGRTIAAEGSYDSTFVAAGGCDSLVRLSVRFVDPDTTLLTERICAGDSLLFGGQYYAQSGSFRQNLVNAAGCDSLVELTLIVEPSYLANRDTAFCAGGSVTLGSTTVRTPGAFRQNFTTRTGCDSVVVWNVRELAPRVAVVAPADTLTCRLPRIELVVNARVAAPAVASAVSWRGPPGTTAPVGGVPWSVTAPGRYVAAQTLTFAGVSCAAADSVAIALDTAAAEVSLGDAVALDCRTPVATVIADYDPDVDYAFAWSVPSGAVAAGDSAVVDRPGAYRLAAERVDNGCRDTARFAATLDTLPPALDYVAPAVLTCARDTVDLDASATFAGGGVGVAWYDTGRAPLASSAGVARVGQAGAYRLIATALATGCQDSAIVRVDRDTSGVRIAVEPPDALTCDRDSVALAFVPSRASAVRWVGPGGDTIAFGPSVRVGSPGRYLAYARAADDGCVATAAVAVEIDTVAPTALIAVPDTLRCFPPFVVVDAAGSSSASGALAFAWTTTDGTILTGSLSSGLRVSAGGTYELAVTDPANGCSDSASVRVVARSTPPAVDVGPDVLIDCDNASVTIGDTAAVDPGLTYRWSGPAGGIVGVPLGPRATVSRGGAYVLTVIDAATACTARDTVEVDVELGVPAVAVPDTVFLDCQTRGATLDAGGSSSGAGYALAWTTRTGRIVGPADGTTLEIAGGGRYRLTVTDTRSNCSAFAEAVVVDLCTPALSLASRRDTISCATGPSTRLEAIAVLGPGVEVAWTTRDGLIVDGAATLTPRVGASGTYRVRLEQTLSGAEAVDSVVVATDTLRPVAQAGPDQLLDCDDISACVPLDAGTSTVARAAEYTWTALGGQFCGDTAGVSVRVNAPGLYELEVRYPSNGCADRDVLVATAEPGVPAPSAGPDALLACGADSVVLSGSPGVDTAGRTWRWVDAGGAVLSATNARAVTVRSGGRYAFEVSDAASGCTAADTVFVLEQACAPNAAPVASGSITCARDAVSLSTPELPGMTASWRGVDVTFGPVSGFAIDVGQPGTYEVIVAEPATGRADTARVAVVDQRVRPVARAGVSGELTCAVRSVVLEDRRSDDPLGGALDYAWRRGGVAVGTGVNVATGFAGTHSLVVTSRLTGCSDTASVMVAIDTVAPVAMATVSGPLDCVADEVTLDAGSSVSAGPLSYAWAGPSGAGLTAATAQATRTDLAGTYELSIEDTANGCRDTSRVEVVGYRPSDVDAGADTELDCATGTAELTATAPAGGVGVWHNLDAPNGCVVGLGGAAARATCPGRYVYAWTTPEGRCTYADTVVVSDPVVDLGLAVGGDTVLTCARASVVLTGSATASGVREAAWLAMGAAGDALTVTAPGVYAYAARDGAGCADTLAVVVSLDTVAPDLDVRAPERLTCVRSVVELSAEVSSTRGVRYAWAPSPGLTGDPSAASVRIRAPGLYRVEVTDTLNGCTASRGVVVEADTVRPGVVLDAPEGTVLDCSRESLRLAGNVDPARARLSWSGPAGQPLVAGSSVQTISLPGVYQLSAVDPANGCVAADLVVVEDRGVPVEGYALSVGGSLGCGDDAVFLLATLPDGVEVTWVGADGSVVNPMGVRSAGTYFATLRDTVSGCRAVDSVRVEDYVPGFSLGVGPVDTLDCGVASVTLAAVVSGSAPVGTEYAFVGPSGDTVARSAAPTLTIAQAGTWQIVSIEPGTGCTQAASAEVSADAAAIAAVGVDIEAATCPGERDGLVFVESVAGGTAPYTYAFGGEDYGGVGQFALLTAGTYELVVTDAAGCALATTVVVPGAEVKEIRLPDAYRVDRDSSLCLEVEVEGGAADRVRWWPAEAFTCDTCAATCVLAEALAGFERVEVYVDVEVDGCSERRYATIDVEDRAPVAWASGFSPNGDGENDAWRVRNVLGVATAVRVYDRWGSIVWAAAGDGTAPLPEWDGRQDGRRLLPGVFVVDVEGEWSDGRRFRVYGDVTLVR